jgi:radial spoke head protein 1
LIYSDKSEYYGQWVGGKKHGEGMHIYPNKDVFSGNWLNGKKHGAGTYVFSATGMKYIGEWYENKFLKLFCFDEIVLIMQNSIDAKK